MEVAQIQRTNKPAATQEEATARVIGTPIRVVYDYGEQQTSVTHKVIGACRLISGLAVRVDVGTGQARLTCDTSGVVEVLVPGGELVLTIEPPRRGVRVLGPSIQPSDRDMLLAMLGEERS
jgi:hypothetical protein